MGIQTRVKFHVNRVLARFNLALGTRTWERLEKERLEGLERGGHFEKSVCPLLPHFEKMNFGPLLRCVEDYRGCFEKWVDRSRNPAAYAIDNDYFTSPDAEILYAMVRKYRPRRVIEVGSGASTRLLRLAVMDGRLDTQIVSIDPRPRDSIRELVDEFFQSRVEDLGGTDRFSSLGPGDILFIDSSHEIRAGNDVIYLYLNVLPQLNQGVLVHVHDVFLPYEYPREWLIEKAWLWNEQYLIQALLMFGRGFEVLWAGHFLQRTLAGFAGHFPLLEGRTAKSLWLKRTASPI